MDMQTRHEEQFAVAAPRGRIDAVTAGAFEAAVKDLAGKTGCRHLILNFADVEYISSAGLRAILSIAKFLKAQGGGLIFAALGETVLNVFKISGFESMFPVCPDEDAAIKKAKG